MNEIKNAVKSTDRRMDQAEGRVYGLEDRNFEITQSEENKGKRVKKTYMIYGILSQETTWQLLVFQENRGEQGKIAYLIR